MDGRLIWTDCEEAGYYVVPNMLSPRDLVSRPDYMDETVPHTRYKIKMYMKVDQQSLGFPFLTFSNIYFHLCYLYR